MTQRGCCWGLGLWLSGVFPPRWAAPPSIPPYRGGGRWGGRTSLCQSKGRPQGSPLRFGQDGVRRNNEERGVRVVVCALGWGGLPQPAPPQHPPAFAMLRVPLRFAKGAFARLVRWSTRASAGLKRGAIRSKSGGSRRLPRGSLRGRRSSRSSRPRRCLGRV